MIRISSEVSTFASKTMVVLHILCHIGRLYCHCHCDTAEHITCLHLLGLEKKARWGKRRNEQYSTWYSVNRKAIIAFQKVRKGRLAGTVQYGLPVSRLSQSQNCIGNGMKKGNSSNPDLGSTCHLVCDPLWYYCSSAFLPSEPIMRITKKERVWLVMMF